MTTLSTHPNLSNLLGPLGADTQARLRRVIADPAAHWAVDRSIILQAGGLLTLWKAVVGLDGSYRDPERCPDSVLVARAIKAAAGRHTAP